MNRPPIPAEIRRFVLVEAGHRCAIPTCRYPDVDVHHIIPWATCLSHDFENLITLCPNCHRRADAGGIDRKSLRLYKAQLTASVGVERADETRLSTMLAESVEGSPGYEFEFQIPTFPEVDLLPVSAALEAWGNELLHRHRIEHRLDEIIEDDLMRGPNTTSGSYQFVRNDGDVLSIKYQVNRYYTGAAHGGSESVAKNYLLNPLSIVSVNRLFNAGYLERFSELSRESLLLDPNKDRKWIYRGTEPTEQHFRSINISDTGLLISFDEYQVDCFAAGPQVVEIKALDIDDFIKPKVRYLWAHA